MSKLPMTFACGLYDRLVPLYLKEVQPDGIDLNMLLINDPRIIFDRMGGGQEFDAAEFSSSEYVVSRAMGDSPFIALPFFPSRIFRHSMVTINAHAGIKSPKDLEGKRVGTPLYTQTAGIFVRGMLQHDYGVDLSTIRWVQGALNHPGPHGTPAAHAPLKPVNMELADPTKSLSALIDTGEIDAIVAYNVPDSLKTSANVVRLFPNYREVERDYFRRTGIFPIMHLVAMRRDTHERYPFAATSLYSALVRSHERATMLLRSSGSLRCMLPWSKDEIDDMDDVFGGDAWPSGIEANRKTLEALVTYMHEQFLIPAPIPIEELFVKIYESY
jgi:4,5-dihydroxyphthalate decarboxylase